MRALNETRGCNNVARTPDSDQRRTGLEVANNDDKPLPHYDLSVERETGIEPATNGLGSRDSTTELLPRGVTLTRKSIVRFVSRDSGAGHVVSGERASETHIKSVEGEYERGG
jgi:hypothetical protein